MGLGSQRWSQPSEFQTHLAARTSHHSLHTPQVWDQVSMSKPFILSYLAFLPGWLKNGIKIFWQCHIWIHAKKMVCLLFSMLKFQNYFGIMTEILDLNDILVKIFLQHFLYVYIFVFPASRMGQNIRNLLSAEGFVWVSFFHQHD